MADAPDINAFLDAQEGGTPAAPEAPPAAPEAPAAAPAAAPEATPETPAADPFDDTAVDKFDRPYVEKLRKESQGYREKYKPFREAFDGYNTEEQTFLLELAKELRVSPETAAARMQQVADALLNGNQNGAAPEAPAAPVTDAERPLTASEVARMLDDRDNRKAQEAAIGDVYKQAESLGYKQNTRELIELLYVAANETDNDVAKADQVIKAERQKIIDEYVAQKAKDSDDTPSMATPGGSAPSGEHKIANLKDAKAATIEFLKNQG